MNSSAAEEPTAPELHSSAEATAHDAESTSTSTGIAIVSSASYVNLAASLVRAIALANILGPTGQGILTAVRLVAGYCSHSQVGMMHGMNKLMPVALGRQEHERAHELQNTAFTATTALIVIVGLAVSGCAFADLRHLDPQTRMALALGGVLVIASQVTSFITCVLRTYGRYSIIGRVMVLTTVVEFGLSIGLAILVGARGAVAGFTLAQLAVLVYLLSRGRVLLAFRLRWPEVGDLLRAGIPLTFMLLTDQLYRTVDMALLGEFKRAHALGLYGPGAALAAMLYTVPNAMAYVLFPEYLRTYGKEGAEGLRGQLFKATIGLASLMPVMAGVGYLLCPCLIPLVLPDYVEGIGAIQVLLLGSALLGLPVAADQALITFNREKRLIVFRGFGALIIASVTFVLVRGPLDGGALLRAVALGACAGYTVAGALSLLSAFAVYEERPTAVAGETALCFLPLAFCLGALWGAQRLAQALAGHLGVLATTGIALPTFLLACAPLLAYLERRTGLVSRFVRAVRRRRRGASRGGT